MQETVIQVMGDKKFNFEPGANAKRDKMDDVRFDLIPPFALKRLAQTSAEGAKKYGDHNFYKGLKFSNLMNHALNHLNKFMCDDRSEDHLAHAMWNIAVMIEFQEMKKHGLNDIYHCNTPKIVDDTAVQAAEKENSAGKPFFIAVPV